MDWFEIHLSLVHIRKTDYLFARTKPTPSKTDFNFRDQNQHHRRLQGDQQASKASKAIKQAVIQVIPLALPLFILIIRRDQY
ncbi:hypothetical protein PGT21_000745 [Puccinia graminis f. sp. tritici]|uniref:Uncharacterized protein n=1 Tax=Puccinia graminis f. sp. tritici TaxID=56615 RepID=A0A5B0M9E7_PUCGR|nr:hypothetical protein PGT21_000745 [Puccinia graminis f. sp. tritici]